MHLEVISYWLGRIHSSAFDYEDRTTDLSKMHAFVLEIVRDGPVPWPIPPAFNDDHAKNVQYATNFCEFANLKPLVLHRGQNGAKAFVAQRAAISFFVIQKKIAQTQFLNVMQEADKTHIIRPYWDIQKTQRWVLRTNDSLAAWYYVQGFCYALFQTPSSFIDPARLVPTPEFGELCRRHAAAFDGKPDSPSPRSFWQM